MQANKNGYLYVIDRLTGKLISARNFVPVTWSKGVDPATGRPIEIGDPRYTKTPAVIFPSSFGAHNWQPMAFSQKTGLVYIPAQEIPGAYGTDTKFEFDPGQWNTAVDTKLNSLPSDPKARAAMRNSMRGELIAWDPAAGKEIWRAEHKGPWNGGVLTTAGGLVFQGTADGHFDAYDAANGKLMWSTDTYTSTLAGPVTYTVDGEQYVAVGAGFGSVFYLVAGFAAPVHGNPDNGRILVYKLGGAARLPAPNLTKIEMPKPPPATAAPTLVATGHATYNHYCLVCHGYNAISGGVIPDLRYSPLIGNDQAFDTVVLGGALKDQGMVSFAKVLKPEDTRAIRAYVISEANTAYAEEHAPAAKGVGK
jgi:glucose dehydrogenase